MGLPVQVGGESDCLRLLELAGGLAGRVELTRCRPVRGAAAARADQVDLAHLVDVASGRPLDLIVNFNCSTGDVPATGQVATSLVVAMLALAVGRQLPHTLALGRCVTDGVARGSRVCFVLARFNRALPCCSGLPVQATASTWTAGYTCILAWAKARLG